MTELLIATVFSGLTVGLLAALTVVWIQNYRTFETPLTLGLVAFSVVLLLENAVAVYFNLFRMDMLYAADPTVGTIVMVMRGLQFVAVLFLTYVTFK
jgi:hypothetical protein